MTTTIFSGSFHGRLHCALGTLGKSATLAVVLSCTSQVASAQQRTPDGAQQKVAGSNIEEIVVTARKRRENLLDVPISITVLGEQDLNRAGGKNLRDLEFAIPNVTFYDQNDLTKSSVTVRGISTDVRNIGTEVSFATYLDGILLARPGAFYAAQNDLAQVEILRGPQGTIFGRNSLSGAFNATTNKPENDFSLYGTVGTGNYNLFEARGVVNVPLVDDELAGRLSFNLHDREGFVKNVYLNETTASYSPRSVRGALRWTPGQWTVDLSADYTYNKIDFYTIELMADTPVIYNGCEYPNVVNHPAMGPILCGYVPGPRTIADGRPGLQSGKNAGVHLIIDRPFGDGYTVQSLSAYRTTDTAYDFGLQQTPDPQGIGRFRDENEQFSQELRILSPGADAQRRYDFVAGLYYLHLPAEGVRSVNLEYDPAILPPGFVNETLTLVSQNTDSYAAYVNGNYYIGDAITLNAGVRLTRESKDYDFLQNGNPQSFTPIVLRRGGEFDESNVSPTVALGYAFNKEMVMYAKWARGFKPGGFNVDFTVPGLPDAYDSERMDLYELGFKTELWDRRLRLTLAAFEQAYVDQQNPVIDAVLQGSFVLNAGSAFARGYEIEAQLMPTSALLLKAGYGYTDARYEDDQPSVGDPIIQAQIDRLAGKPLPRSNKHGANLSASYTFQMGQSGSLRLGSDYSYRSSQNFDAINATGSVYRLNGNMVYSAPGDAWQVELWGRNLLNEDYIASVFANQFTVGRLGVIYGMPREYGLRMSYRYR